MQKIQGNTDDVLSRIELRDDEKAKRYLQLQNRYLVFKEQSSSRTRPGEINSAVPELPSTVLPTPLNPFNATPDLNQAAILQKLEKESSTPPPPLNPAFLTPPAAVETPTLATVRDNRKSRSNEGTRFMTTLQYLLTFASMLDNFKGFQWTRNSEILNLVH